MVDCDTEKCAPFSATEAQELLTTLDDIPICLQPNYLTSNRVSTTQYQSRISNYLLASKWSQEDRITCQEDHNPAFRQSLDQYTGSLSTQRNLTSSISRVACHAAYAGAVTPMHFDWDLSTVLHICLSGRRRVWIAEPSGRKLLPCIGNTISLDFELLEKSARRELLEYFGATPFDLAPGEAVQFPSHFWHTVEYTTKSSAISVRDEWHPIFRPIMVLPRSLELQLIFNKLLSMANSVKYEVVSDIVESFLGDVSRAQYNIMLADTLVRLEIELNSQQPWIFASDFGDRQFAVSEHRLANDTIVKLYKEWLFFFWPNDIAFPLAARNALAAYAANAKIAPAQTVQEG